MYYLIEIIHTVDGRYLSDYVLKGFFDVTNALGEKRRLERSGKSHYKLSYVVVHRLGNAY